MDGRVKTLHPAIHGGLLALRDDPAHRRAMATHGIGAIDLPGRQPLPVRGDGRAPAPRPTSAIENIDIGGPAMIRAAAKNAAWVTVVTDPADYAARRRGARGMAAARARCAAASPRRRLPARPPTTRRSPPGTRASARRGLPGAARRRRRRCASGCATARTRTRRRRSIRPREHAPGIAAARQVQGKALSYNNINDADAAFELVARLSTRTRRPAVAIIKHANPCGAALGDDRRGRLRRALALRPGLRLRRHRRGEPPARRARRRRRSPASSPRWSSRRTRTKRRSRSSPRSRTCGCC